MLKYYYAGATRLAMRVGANAPSYLLGDHLGSTSITADGAGNKIAEMRYLPWGGQRYASGTTPTAYRFTGQREDSYINLIWYNSRWYDPALGRWTQPDSIVPEAAQGVQAWDRFAYANNNAVRFTDPTGHCTYSTYCPWLPPTEKPGLPNAFEQADVTYTGVYNNTVTLEPPLPSYEVEGWHYPMIDPLSYRQPGFAGFWELRNLDGLGIRGLDVSGWIPYLPVVGGNLSGDVVYNWRSGELSLLFTPSGLWGIGEGASRAVGFVGLYNVPYSNALRGPGGGVQGTVIPGVGITASYAIGRNPTADGNYPQVWYLGVGGGGEFSGSVFGGSTIVWTLWDFKK